MELRDEFAFAALKQLLAQAGHEGCIIDPDDDDYEAVVQSDYTFVRGAYDLADIMLEVREEGLK